MPFACATLKLIPHTRGALAGEVGTTREKVRRLDLPAAAAAFFGITLLVVGLTLGSTYGFRTAKSLAPFLISWIFLFGFFVRENMAPPEVALIPPSFWKIPNMMLLSWLALGSYSSMVFALVGLFQRWEISNHQSPIISALRFLPSCAIGIPLSGPFQKLCERRPGAARWVIGGGNVMVGVGYILFVFSEGQLGAFRLLLQTACIDRSRRLLLEILVHRVDCRARPSCCCFHRYQVSSLSVRPIRR